MSENLPQFLLVSPPLDDPAVSDGRCAAALERLLGGLEDPLAIGLSALLLRDGILDDEGFLAVAAPMTEIAQAAGIAVILENRSNLVGDGGCDGVQVPVGEKGSPIRKLRQQLGSDLIIGASCGASRHAAMLAGEQGADYIGFGAVDGSSAVESALVDWWVRDMTPPLVAFGAPSVAEVRALAAAGADFVALGAGLWLEREDPGAVLQALLEEGGTAA